MTTQEWNECRTKKQVYKKRNLDLSTVGNRKQSFSAL
jgi:hypothetical protein